MFTRRTTAASDATVARTRRVDNLSIVDKLSNTVIHPLHGEDAKRLIGRILQDGIVSFSNHALDEMAKDALTTLDVQNVLRGGVVEFAEEVKRSWRYRVRTPQMTAVIAFRDERSLVVVTAWRKAR